MGAREAWAIIGGGPPHSSDTRFDCVGAFSKSDYAPNNSFGSCTLVAPNVIVTARHNLNPCGNCYTDTCVGCFCCYDGNPGSSPSYVVRFRRQIDGTVAPANGPQYEVPVLQFFFPATGPGCCDLDVAVGILAWPVTHITPAVVDYDLSYDPPNNRAFGRQPEFAEFSIAGWGQNELNQMPGTLLVATMNGRPSEFSKYPRGGFHDSGGAVLLPGSCGRMRLVGVIVTGFNALRCYEFPPEIRQQIPTPQACEVGLTVVGIPEPTVEGRLTATAMFLDGDCATEHGFSDFAWTGWAPCGAGLCSGLISRGTSAGIVGTASAPGECWHSATASCSGSGAYDMEIGERLRMDFNLEASHAASVSGLPGGGTEPNSLGTDTLLGTPSNSLPFEATVPLNVTGPSSGSILRILASSLVGVDFGPNPPAPPAELPIAVVDVRTIWDLYADMNADGLIDSGDIQVGHEECVGREWPNLIGVRLASVAVGAGRHVLKIKCIVDVRIRSNIADCVPSAVYGEPNVATQLRLEVIPDSYGGQ